VSTEEPFRVALGGRSWDLPHLPFRAIKKIQPALFRTAAVIGDDPAGVLIRLDEEKLDDFLKTLHLALQVVEPALTLADLEVLHFTVNDLIATSAPLYRACGMKFVKREAGAPEASPPPGE
jgi:hypothetical protein